VPYTYVYLCHIHHIPLKEKKNREPLNPELKIGPPKQPSSPTATLSPPLLSSRSPSRRPPTSPLVPPPDAPCLSLASGGSSSPARRETGSPKNPGMEEVVSRGERSRGGQICDCEERRGAAPA